MGFYFLLALILKCTLILCFVTPDHLTSQNSVRTVFALQEPVVIFMFEEVDVKVNYSLPCADSYVSIYIEHLKENDIFNVLSNSTITIPCDANGDSSTLGNGRNKTLSIDGVLTLRLRSTVIGLSRLGLAIRDQGSNILQYDEVGGISMYNSSFEPQPGVRIDANGGAVTHWFPVTVLRKMRPVDHIFRYLLGFMVILLTMGFGCKLDMGVVKECLRRPVAPGIGFGCQYLLMPLIGYGVARLVPLGDKSVSLGVFLCGVCPGGGLSNIYTYLLDGDVSLSITMTFVSSVASIGMMPLWIYTLGSTLVDDSSDIRIPYLNILQVIASVVIPLFIGIFIKYKFTKVALFIIKVLKPTTLVCIIVFLTVGIWSNLYIFKMFRPVHVLAGCLLPYFGYLLGGVIAVILRQPKARVVTIALETGMQNIGIAMLVLLLSFPPPLGDIATVAPLSSAMMTPIPPFVVTIVYNVYVKFFKKYEPVNVNDEKIDVQSKNIVEKLSSV
ncbi:ileal sodium/bile acid cotransporter-like [Mya arenaria]|uniref:ileal sodium/bile acid cotransporter-like n=1 Tax=Mya arenaria TaxID=6604 RepID=UPI0022E6AA59|nr:ileal sodium/bile acid cotransporter-like [Mya arenaria]